MCFAINRRFYNKSNYDLALRPVTGACVPFTSNQASVGDTRAKGDIASDGKTANNPSSGFSINITVHPGTPPLSDGCLSDDDSTAYSLDTGGFLTPNDTKLINFFSGETLEDEVVVKEEPISYTPCRLFSKWAEIFKEENELFDKEHSIVSTVTIGTDGDSEPVKIATAVPDTLPATNDNSNDAQIGRAHV